MPATASRSPRAPDRRATAAQIMDVAERLAQTRGFNGFSYADIAAELRLTKASLHYHFASKTDLGLALIERYAQTFAIALQQIDESGASPRAALDRYVELYAEVAARGQNCLCGMFAAEFATLPEPMQGAIRAFFDANEAWLAGVLAAGRRAGAVGFEGSARDAARAVTAGLEGALLLARPYADVGRFTTTAKRIVREVARSAPARARPVRVKD